MLGSLEWEWENFPFPKLRTLPPNQEEDEAVDPFNAVFGVSKRRWKGIDGGVLGEWTYSRDFEPGLLVDGVLPEKLTVSVRRPLGDRLESYFSVYPAKDLSGQPAPQWGTGWNEYGLSYTRSVADPLGGERYLSSRMFDCDGNGANCALVRSEYVAYELDDDSIQNDKTGILFNKNRRLSSRRVLDHYMDEGGEERTDHRLEVFGDFDGLGHYRQSTVSSNFGPTRTVRTEFDPDRGVYPGSFSQIPATTPWITDLFDARSISESGRTARRLFCHDEATGFLERRWTLKASDGERSPGDVVEVMTADARGQAVAHFWFGGDLIPVTTVGDPCEIGLGTSSFRRTHTYDQGVLETSRFTYHDGSFDTATSGGPLTFYSVQNTSIDPSTGLVAERREPSGLTTSYVYDELGRLRLVKPSAASGAAWTKVWHGTAVSSVQPARAEVRELPNGSVSNADALTEKRYRWDGLGRLDQEQVRLPPGSGAEAADRYHFYDAEGRRSGTTTWGGNQTTSFREFDPFGRPRLIYPPDASPSEPGHGVTLRYEGFRKTIRTLSVGSSVDARGRVVETPVRRTEEFDAFGRLVAVTEPSVTGGADVRTAYAYDLADRLIGVSMPVAGGPQTRSWDFDQRGNLLSECHPEKAGSCTTYSMYNPLGQPGRVVDGPFVRDYAYDRAGGRVTTVRDGGGRLLKRLAYGRSSTASNRANGRLIRAVNFQYPDLGAGSREQRFAEDFEYGGVGGARDFRKVTWIRQCEPGETSADCLDDGFCDEESFEHRETFDPTGKLVDLIYPTCTSADNGCGAPHPRTVSQVYDPGSGFLTAVPGWAPEIGYHRNMTLRRLEHANGVVDRVGLDPDLMTRPASMQAESAGGQTLWQSGTFRFDGAGNVLELSAGGESAGDSFTDRFVYDGVSRLRSSKQWIRRSTVASIFADGFESAGTEAWIPDQEPYASDVYTEQSFAFDAPGNLLAITTDGQTRAISVSSTTNRLTGNAQYDGAGNLTQLTDEDGVTSFVYDAFNRLIRRSRGGHVTHFFYTVDDERILRFGTDGFLWSLRDLRGRILREFRPESNRLQPVRDHIYRGRLPLATVAVDGSDILSRAHHLSLDHLGSPRLLTDGAGRVVAEHKYRPFGGEATRADQNDLPLKFTGHERDFYATGKSDDLDYMHARFCDPRLGRFLSPDPAPGDPEMPQSWNRFAYVRNNPLKYVDPDGRETSAHIHLDRDVEDLQSGRIDVEQYWERIRARGNGALFGVSMVYSVEQVVLGAILKGGRLGKVGAFFKRLFGRGKGSKGRRGQPHRKSKLCSWKDSDRKCSKNRFPSRVSGPGGQLCQPSAAVQNSDSGPQRQDCSRV